MSHSIGKRKREGKESDLYVDGALIPKQKYQKETARNSFIPAGEKYAQGMQCFSVSSEDWDLMRYPAAPSPEMPAGVVVCTPTSSDLDTFSLENIPWFRFRSILESQGIVRWASRQNL